MSNNEDVQALFSDRNRLMIMVTLASSKRELDFSTLVRDLGLTRGNLSTHMKRLENAGLIETKKEFVDLRPRTTYRCTAAGRRALRAHLEEIERMLKDI